MPSASMNRLMDNARVRLPGALDATIQYELFSAVDTLCRTAGVWKMDFDVDVIPTENTFLQEPDDYTYQIFPPAGSTSVRIVQMTNANGTPVACAMEIPNYIQISTSPNEEQTYTVKVVMSVTDPVTRAGEPVIPDWIVDRYNDVLLDGVLAGMMSQAAKPYSSVNLGMFHSGKFKSGVSSARIEANRKNVAGGQAWRFPQSFATRNR